MATLNHRLDAFVERHGQNEVDSAASRAIALVDYRIGRVLTVLDDLAARGAAFCRVDHLDVLRAANLKTSPIKEFSIVASDGRTLCTDLGTPSDERVMLATQNITARPDVGVENVDQVVALRERGIRAAQGYVSAPPLPGPAFLELPAAIDPQSSPVP
jgi:sensor c-di-GMP phosphodiesterase-like protein